MRRSIYGIHGNNDVVFFDLESAETYVLRNYSEHISCKDQFIEYCEEMIWEDYLVECVYCNELQDRSFCGLKSSNCGDHYYHDYCSM
jgi:hypothetical protein